MKLEEQLFFFLDQATATEVNNLLGGELRRIDPL